MDTNAITGGLTIAGAMFLAPVLMRIWRNQSPPPVTSEFDLYDADELKRRNRGIYLVSYCLSCLGIFSPIFLLLSGLGKDSPWMLGLGFGLAVILPVTFASLVTLPQGRKRFLEFWRFFELQNRLSLGAMFVVTMPLAILGFVSLYKIAF